MLLDSISIWEQKWKMSFNITKCHIMHITRSKRRLETLHNQPLSTIDQTTYLGVEISSGLSLDSTYKSKL